jgi:phage baseplate assembly protein W
MPLERVSRGFNDISMSFQINPLNNDIIGIKNETAIARSIRNIVLTQPGEKFFNPFFGSKVKQSLFETFDDITSITVRNEIRSSIQNYEPRVELIEVKVIPDYDNNNFNVTIIYKIIGADVQPQRLEFVLLPSK